MTMNRRNFMLSGAALALASRSRLHADSAPLGHTFPPDIIKNEWYVEAQPIPEYHWAPASAYEAFQRHEVRHTPPLGHLFHLAQGS